MQEKTGFNFLHLLKATLDSANDLIQVLKVVRNEEGTITDFVYVLNNRAAEKIYGDQTGQSRQKDFEICKHVVETGEPVQQEIYELTDYYHQSFVKLEDGVSITAHNITGKLQQAFLLALSDSLHPLSDSLSIQTAATEKIAAILHTAHAFYIAYDGVLSIEAEYLKTGAPSLIGDYSTTEYAWLLDLLEKGAPLILNDSSDHAMPVKALIAVPLIKNGALLGAFCVAEQSTRIWTGTETALVKEAGERIWAAVERARAEQALHRNEMQLKELLRQKEIFIGIASHELKTPVTGMKVYAEMIHGQLEELGYKEEASLMQRLNKQIDKLTTLINHLLDTNRIAGGELQLNLEKTDLTDLLREKINEIQVTTTHQLLLETSSLPHVMIDRERISQVLMNLFTNAIRYSPGGSAITINGRSTPNGVEISIRDEGFGITHEKQDQIFERFFRGNAPTSEKNPGLGLGLYLTAQIIHRHHGQIRVESTPGKGSTFYFTIPGDIAS